MKYIELLTVELCREVRRGEEHLRRNEFNFLQHTVPESHESIVSEGSGKVSEVTDYLKVVLFGYVLI